MARLPEPPEPETLRALLRPADDIVAAGRATRLGRVFAAAGLHRQRWNTFRQVGPLPHARFDPHPVPPDGRPAASEGNGVIYFGMSARTSIAEVFQTTSI